MITKVKVLKKGIQVFGSNKKFNLWLNEYNKVLKEKPIILCETDEGLEDVYVELLRIEHGILA